MDTLTDYDKKILAVLNTEGGFTTVDVATKITPRFGSNNRQHSAAVRSWLCRLERNGLVRKLDDLKPVCWVKTA